MRDRQSALSDRDKALAESTAAIVEKDRLIAQLRDHLREEAELESEEDGTRSPRRTVFSRVNESLEEDIANMRTLLAESTNNLEATRRERYTLPQASRAVARLSATPVSAEEARVHYGHAEERHHCLARGCESSAGQVRRS